MCAPQVYTVVNTESGQLLAMKEISIAAGDRRAVQKAANELRVLEGVIHPHLVRYYGCELHRVSGAGGRTSRVENWHSPDPGETTSVVLRRRCCCSWSCAWRARWRRWW